MPRLQLTGVGRRYAGHTPVDALDAITLSIEQGEFIAIEGPSGGGKSTLLNVIGLLDDPTYGTYRVGEMDTGQASPKEIAQLRSDRFAFIFQSFHLLDRRPVIDSVELGLLYRAVPRNKRRQLGIEALREVGLEKWADQTANKLSGGERQRVAIARALAVRAPIVVADEPTGNLDSTNSDAVVDSLHALHRAGSTIVLVTHSADVASAAGRRISIRDGRLHERSPRVAVATSTEPPTPPGRASSLRLQDVFIDAIASVRSRLGKSAGLIVAVAVGVALAVATLGISVSASAQVAETFDASTNRDVTVAWPASAVADQPTVAVTSMVDRLEGLAGTQAAGLLTDYGQHSIQASATRPTFQVNAYTATPGTLTAARAKVGWAPGHRAELATGEVLLGHNLASQLELGPLIGSPVITVDGRTVTVVGVIASTVRLPLLAGSVVLASGNNDLENPGQVQAIILTQPGAAQQIARQAPLVIDPYEPDSLVVTAPVDPKGLRAQVESELQVTLLALTGAALLASIAGLANSMMLSVLDRKQEFGLRRAVGARPKHIVALVLTESTLIGAAGGILGLVLGLGAVLAVTLARHWVPVFDLHLAPVAIVAGIVVGGIGGILASTRASQIQPNEALRL